MTSPDSYTQDELAAAGLATELVLGVAFIDDGKGNIRRAFLTESDAAMVTGGERIVGIVAPPANLCLVRENPAPAADGKAVEPATTIGVARIDPDGNLNVGEPWAVKTREALAWHAELNRLRGGGS